MLLSFSHMYTSGQTCAGSLGDPIVNVTFGSGSNFGSPLPAGSTSILRYQASICPVDGNYAIVSSTSGCWAGDVVWHNATDHTAGSNGYFMLVNASFQPSDFYIQTITGLCEGTSYRFASWLLNMCSVTGILPDITFTIERTDGTILSTYNSGPVPIRNPVTWEEYGFTFTTPPGVSTVVLRIRNNAPGGVGNDVGLDDISFRAVGPSVSVGIKGASGNEFSFCPSEQETSTLESQVEDCYEATAYQWQVSTDEGITFLNIPGANAPEYVRLPSPPGRYLYRLTVAQEANIGKPTCQVSSSPISINILQNPAANLGVDTFLCRGSVIQLYAGEFETYTWQDGSSASSFTADRPGTYSVVVTNGCGSSIASINIAEKNCALAWPNAFTPNGDGRNDRFTISNGLNVLNFSLAIYNRWGQKIYSTNDPLKGWDGFVNGRRVSAGQYVWHSVYDDPIDKTMKNVRGTLTLIR